MPSTPCRPWVISDYEYMPKMLRIGMMTPSSNTILEPMTQRILRDMSHVSTHFSRLRVTEVSLAEQADGQFGLQQIVESAELLSDAKVHVMGWNATSASWRGFDTDKLLCSTLSQRYGIPATTAVLALNELLNLFGIRRFALVTPYLKNVQDKINVFYPSSVFVNELPSQFSEYSIIKKAGETYGAYIQKFYPNIRFFAPYLPRLATDQTMSIIKMKLSDPFEILQNELVEFHNAVE